MKFCEYKYERLDFDEISKAFKTLLDEFNSAQSASDQDEVMTKINQIRNRVTTIFSLGSIRHVIDTTDEFYDEEYDYINEVAPKFEGLQTEFYKALINSKYRDDLSKKWGEHLFNIAETQLKTFKPEIIELLQQENKRSSAYTKLLSSAQIDFDGGRYNLSQMGPFIQSQDRDTRRRAYAAYSKFFSDNLDEFDTIYDDLVKLRHEIALKLGYQNYVELGYARLSRTDYDAKDVANYRRQVYENLVPVATSLKKRQAKRLGIDKLKHYDESLKFTSGNATPKGNAKWMVDNARQMYRELSAQTDEFFSFMQERELLDLLAKKGKAPGGFCEYLSDYKAPFIFANFNGTSDDVDVLTHEAGHAFQVYSSRDYAVPEYNWPTLEACEIHSMSMEFLTWPWMEKFFKEDVEKYKFSHLAGAIEFIPYGVTVDEFQHFVYENPEATPAERRAKWREIERKYLPTRDYSEDEFFESGGYWYRQGHIFGNPFYYIDYTLAQISAFEFWNRSQNNRDEAWQTYLKLCQAGGSKPYTGLLADAGLLNPFNDGTIKQIIKPISEWLDAVDDTEL